MFGKLVSLIQGEKSSHPLGSKENVAQTLSEIPLSDPSRALSETDNWLEDIQRFDYDITPAAMRYAALQLLEHVAGSVDELLLAFLLPGTREHQSELIWSLLDRHYRVTFEAMQHCLSAALTSKEDLSKEKMLLALCASRGMAAWVERKKLHHFRYRPPEAEWWSNAYQLIGLASKHGVLTLFQPLYGEEGAPRNTLHLYLSGLYLELAPLSNLVAIQVEVLQRWLLENAGQLEFAEQPHAAVTHCININDNSSPVRYNKDLSASNYRYCSIRRLRTPLLQFGAALHKAEGAEDWLLPFLAHRDNLLVLVQSLMSHWSEQPPKRSSARQREHKPIRVVTGLGLARRMIACASFAKRGGSLSYRSPDLEGLFNEIRFGVSANSKTPEIDAGNESLTPLEVLLRLETSGDKQMMDEWDLADRSEGGFGALSPGLRNRNRIGELIGFRFENEIDWQLGVIRRLGRDQKRRASIGVSYLPGDVYCAQIKLVDGQRTVWNDLGFSGTGFMDAIALKGTRDELIVQSGIFSAGLKLILGVDGKRHHVRLTELIEQGNDWERVAYELTPEGS